MLLTCLYLLPMAQKKLQRFADIKTFSNVLEYPENMKGQWQAFFNNANPVILELACGRGEYTIALSQMFKDQNFVGVDIKGNRMYIGARQALTAEIKNAAFLRTQIMMLPNYFQPHEVSEIWITFPDPHLRTSKAKKRLTHPRFLRLYQQVLHPSGVIHLKTDSPALYKFTKQVIDMYELEVIEDCDDVHQKNPSQVLKIKTHYEALDIAGTNTIFYLKFKLPVKLEDHDEALYELLKQSENRQLQH